MRLKELKAKSEGDLHRLLAQKREALRADKFSVSAKQLKDIKAIKKTRKVIAQILTVLNEKKRSPSASDSTKVTSDKKASGDKEDKANNDQ